MSFTRRALLGGLAATWLLPGCAAASNTTCSPPRYLGWIARREARWADQLGSGGFVNYYGEPFAFDSRIVLTPTSWSSCGVHGAVGSTLEGGGRLRDAIHDRLEVGGHATTSNCFVWADATERSFHETLGGLVDQVRSTCADPRSQTVRFTGIGSRHSSSDVAKRAAGGHAVAVHIEGLNQLMPDRTGWRPAFLAAHPDRRFALVGAGITVCQLNEALWNQGLAIETQGSFDGQTLAGAIATGTHGAGAYVGSVGDSVEAVLLLTVLPDAAGVPVWQVVQVEPDPHEAISDPAAFATVRDGLPWRLVQDRRLFEAAVMTFGSMGLVVGYVMKVRPAYFLYETRVGRAWSEVRETLVQRATEPPSGFNSAGWRYELVVSPSPVRRSSDFACTEVYRDEWAYDLDYRSESREIPQKWLGSVTRRMNLGGAVGNSVADVTSNSLVRGKRLGSFADRCYRVLKLGQGEFVQAWGTELMVPAERGAEMVDWVLRTNPERGQLKRGARRGTRLVNPFGVRFCTGRNGFLTPVRWIRDGEPQLVCTAELTEAVKENDRRNRGERPGGRPSAMDVVAEWAEDFVRTFGAEGRVHWGQVQGDYGPEQLAASYATADIDAWYDGFRALNPYGCFDTAFVTRLGFVARRAQDTRPAARYRGLGRPLVDVVVEGHAPHSSTPEALEQ